MTTGCRKLRRVAAAAAVAVAAALRQGKGGESGWERWSGDALLADVGGQPGAELGAEIVAGEGQLDGGAEVVELVADVVAALDERVPVDVLGLEQQADGIRELDLAAATGLPLVEGVEAIGRAHV